ncbi:molybdopterin-dependent oxidoreductase [Catellatospora citrea]|uniref:Molybdopterin-binding protein n=1 Tax=Catellatospora citrea TaxID=53366 RepID=A0A8J3KFD7_9ACTN|nr:molybdopterin-dependent oxidoreductase [Catellatospora citrea]RKE12876.1 DMSO/TMAO reductase YedYZ molybdopterin-dependent catalytic subunit [Catellatospora citrea]GIF95883.1 molybdopterin-binding protein [Catellatospora citrea]
MVRVPEPLTRLYPSRLSHLFTSRLRSPQLTSRIGRLLGIAVAVCFVTGYLSHAIQHPPGWFYWPSRPVNLYRVTQGLHVATGLAIVPLLAAKLWSVYPKLFRWPPFRDAVHAIERLSLFVLVAAALFQVTTGILNIALWYSPMSFFFTTAHYWTAWILVGALAVHIGVKLPVIRRALAAPDRAAPRTGSLSRRGLFAAVGAAIGLITVATIGQTLRPLAGLSVLGPRDPRIGPQGLPVNQSAVAAGVTAAATDPAYRLEVVGPARTLRLTLAELGALAQHTAQLPITCVEGWSATATWGGVRVSDLVAAVGGAPGASVRVESLQQDSLYRISTLAPPHAADPLTLLALRIGGQPLDLDHGYPVRLIAPNRPGVLQTKWVARIEVLQP